MAEIYKVLEKIKLTVERIIKFVIFKLWFMLGKDSIRCHGGELVFIEEINIEKGSVDNGKENQQ